jgi:hypothetical protein
MKLSLHLFMVLLVVFSVSTIQAQTVVQTWDFETALGDWVSGPGGASIALSTEQALGGTQSVKMVKAAATLEINLQNDVYTDVKQGDTLAFNIYLSAADVALVNGVQIFWQTGAGWAWHAQWIGGASLTGDAWNKVMITMPAVDPDSLNRIGLQLLLKSGNEAATTALYVDDIAVVRPDFMIAIDAEKDDWYNTFSTPDSGYLHIQAFHFNDNGRPAGNQDLSVEQWCAWDATWFYLYAEVTDDVVAATSTNAYANDCIEVKVDGEPTDSTGGISQELRLNALLGDETTSAKDTLATIPANAKMWAKKLTDTGYVLEFAIRWDSLDGSEVIDVAVDSIFGMGIGYHDNDNHLPAQREASVTWAAVPLDAIWNTPKYHGTVTFMKNHKLKFDPTNHMTGKTNTLPYDGTVPVLGVIDGEMDPFYSLLSGPDDGYLQIKSYAFLTEYGQPPDGDADYSVKLWSAWDATWFYIYAEFTDDTVSCSNAANAWENDAIELKIDGSPTGAAGQTGVSAAAILTALGSTDNPGGLTDDPTSLYGVDNAKFVRNLSGRDNGEWTLEMAIKIDTLGGTEKIHGAVDSIFGLGIHLIDNDGTTRNSGLVWAARCTDLVWNNLDEHGTVKFLAGNKVQFIAQNNITKKVNPVPYDGTPMYINSEDGILDPFFRTLAGPSTGYVQLRNFVHSDIGRAMGDNGAASRDADLSSKIWMGWDEDWWYVYNQVTDDIIAATTTGSTPWENDCIEIKIDCVIDPADSSSGQAGRREDRLNILGVADREDVAFDTDSLGGTADSLKKIYRGTSSAGYNLEFAIDWRAITAGDDKVVPGVGTQFGLSLANFDNDGNGRDATVMWAAELMDDVWNEVKRMGTVEFLADNKFNMKANNVYGRTNTLPYNGNDYIVPGVGDPIVGTPLVYALKQNYPNPFNPVTNIVYSIPKAGKVNLTIYNILGQKVATLVNNEAIKAGVHTIEFNAAHLATGMYFYRLEFQDKMLVKKMMLIK